MVRISCFHETMSNSNEQVCGPRPDLQLGVIILGDFKVGKSTVLSKLAGLGAVQKGLSSEYWPMSMTCQIRSRDKLAALTVLDTGGQEKYRSLTASYYRGAHGCLILYDVTKESSFDSITYWLHDLKEYASQPEISTIIVGTKCHVAPERREVTYDRAMKFAESLGLPYMEVSAEEGTNVTEVFEKLADLIIEHHEKVQAPVAVQTNRVTLTSQKSKQKKSWCSC